MNKLKKYLLIGTVFTVMVGIISHFVYDWTGGNFFVGLFFPINESTWEHMKLAFFPMLVYSLWATGKLKDESKCISKAFSLGIFAGTFAIPVIFYTYSGILGFNVAWLNILTFIVSVIIGFVVVYVVAKTCEADKYSLILRVVLFVMVIAFMVFTYYPPDIGLFIEKAACISTEYGS